MAEPARPSDLATPDLRGELRRRCERLERRPWRIVLLKVAYYASASLSGTTSIPDLFIWESCPGASEPGSLLGAVTRQRQDDRPFRTHAGSGRLVLGGPSGTPDKGAGTGLRRVGPIPRLHRAQRLDKAWWSKFEFASFPPQKCHWREWNIFSASRWFNFIKRNKTGKKSRIFRSCSRYSRDFWSTIVILSDESDWANNGHVACANRLRRAFVSSVPVICPECLNTPIKVLSLKSGVVAELTTSRMPAELSSSGTLTQTQILRFRRGGLARVYPISSSFWPFRLVFSAFFPVIGHCPPTSTPPSPPPPPPPSPVGIFPHYRMWASCAQCKKITIYKYHSSDVYENFEVIFYSRPGSVWFRSYFWCWITDNRGMGSSNQYCTWPGVAPHSKLCLWIVAYSSSAMSNITAWGNFKFVNVFRSLDADCSTMCPLTPSLLHSTKCHLSLHHIHYWTCLSQGTLGGHILKNFLKEKCISEVVRIGSIMNFHLSELWKKKSCGEAAGRRNRNWSLLRMKRLTASASLAPWNQSERIHWGFV